MNEKSKPRPRRASKDEQEGAAAVPFFNGHAAAYVNFLGCKTAMRHAALLQLAGCCNPETLACFPSQKTLAKRMGIKDRQLRTHLSGLEDEDKIRRIHRYGPDGARTSDGYIIVGLKEYMTGLAPHAQASWELAHRQKPAASENDGLPAESCQGVPAETCQGDRQKPADIRCKAKRNGEKEVNPCHPLSGSDIPLAGEGGSAGKEGEGRAGRGQRISRAWTVRQSKQRP